MRFELLPVIDAMLQLYALPVGMERFSSYLRILEGDKPGDMTVPVAGYNPMAKAQAIDKLAALRTMGAEDIVAATLAALNDEVSGLHGDTVYRVALNMSDDLHGGWTNRYTADYDSRYKLKGLMARNFCTPILWTGEEHTPALVAERTRACTYRTIYRLSHEQPQTLADHIAQEQHVARQANILPPPGTDYEHLRHYYEAHKDSTDILTIMNFLYGDQCI